jgi:hypothetical protein
MQGKVVFARCSANNGLLKLKSVALGSALAATPLALALMLPASRAEANPQFARQTGQNCSFCHSGPPRLNDTGLAFRNNGFRLPDSNKAPDQDHKDVPGQ